MIKAELLTKKFPGRTAIRDLSFEVEKGESVGILGPNGSGKSTVLKILSGFLAPTSGRAFIAGHDLFEQSFRARSKIGYLPDTVPLYDDMRVSEYLRFRGALKGLKGSKLRSRFEQVSESCGLNDFTKRIISSLSKGYRQRVGLADALIHDPELLILDEPMTGLDLNLIRQIQNRTQGQKRTLLVATHQISEIETFCSRTIIMNQGRIETSGSPQELVRKLRTSGIVRLEIKTPVAGPEESLSRIPGVKQVETELRDGWYFCLIRTEANSDLRQEIFRHATEQRWEIRELHLDPATLEDVFLELTHVD
jgi:ABC-2 type transport system ATP-binding protein